MFSFSKKQQVFSFGDVFFGGQPGRYPTVCFGGVFFRGKPDTDAAKLDVFSMYELSEKLGVPAVLDVFIRKSEYIDPVLDFVEQHIPDEKPFSVDITDASVKLEVLKGLDSRGLLGRTIFNSLHVGVSEKEEAALKDHTPGMCLIVAFNPRDNSPDGRFEVLSTGAGLARDGLLSIASEVGFEKVLVDTAALSPGNCSGAALASLVVVKEEFGLPAGCAIHNVVEKSLWLDEFSDVRGVVDAASNSGVSLFGGDFCLFGSAASARSVLPVVAWQDMLVSEYVEQYFGIKPESCHPRRVLSSG